MSVAHAGEHPTFFKTNASGNVSMNVPGPQGPGGNASIASGNATVAYRFEVVDYSGPVDQGLVVRVPQMVAEFPLSSTELTMIVKATVFVVNGAGWSEANSSKHLNTRVTFNNTVATMSSQLVAVTTSLPWSSVSLLFEWEYALTPDPGAGSPANQTWSGARIVVPDESATLASSGGSSVVAGQSYQVCLAGPVEGRTFSLHVETVNVTQVNDFEQINATIPMVTSLPYCWSAVIPLNVSGLSLIVHVWDYQNAYTSNVTTLLLFSIPVTVVAASSAHSGGLFGVSVSTFLTWVTIAAVAAGIALVAFAVYRSRLRGSGGGPVAPGGTRDPPSSTAPAGGGPGGARVDGGGRGPRNQ